MLHVSPEFLYFIHQITPHHEGLEIEMEIPGVDVILELRPECVDQVESQLRGLVPQVTQAVLEDEVVRVAAVA